MKKETVVKVPPSVARDVRTINKGEKGLDHPYYKVEERKGSGKATCRQCGEMIAEGDPTVFFHYAPDDDNTWVRNRGTIHRDDCEGGKDEWTKCPRCRKQVPSTTWSDHWRGHKNDSKAAKQVRKSRHAHFDDDDAAHHTGEGDFKEWENEESWQPVDFHPYKQTGNKCENCGQAYYMNPAHRTPPTNRKVLMSQLGHLGDDDAEHHMGASEKKPGPGQPGDPDGAYTPRVDPYTQDAAKDSQLNQLDEEARKLQKGMKGLDQFAGFKLGKGDGKLTANGDHNMLYEAKWFDDGRYLHWGTCRTCGWASKPAEKDDALQEVWMHVEQHQKKQKSSNRYASKGTWDQRWEDFAKAGLNRDQAKLVWDTFEDARGHKTESLAGYSRAMMNKHFPPPEDEWSACSECRGSGLARGTKEEYGPVVPRGPKEEKYRKCVYCAGQGRIAKKIAINRDWFKPDSYEMRDYKRRVKEHEDPNSYANVDYRRRLEDHRRELEEYNNTPKEDFEECRSCGGTGSNAYLDNPVCGNCKGSGLAPKRDHPPSPPYPPAAPRPPSSPYVNSADGLRAPRFSDRTDHGVHYPDVTRTCPTCSGSGTYNNWENEQENCYSCHGGGTVTQKDPRDQFEHLLSTYKGGKQIVGIQHNTGVHEDADHYHLRFHDTDILSFHKTKPEVSIDMGSGNRWDTMTTKQRLHGYLPRGVSVGNQEVRPGKSSWDKNELVVSTPTAAYKMQQGITINTDTGKATDGSAELFKCKECYRLREDADEMAKHQRRHDSYRAAYEKSPYRSCGDCNGTGGTKSWHTTCKECGGTSMDASTGSMCLECAGSGIKLHTGAQPRTEYDYANQKSTVIEADKCGTCRGEGRLLKRKPVDLKEAS